jgi:Bacterial Ig domain
MNKYLLAAGLIISFLGGGIPSAAANCFPSVRTFHDQTVDGTMTVRSGKRCSISFRSSGPTETTVIIQRPSSGSVSISGGGKVVYQARKGFVGNDTFTYARRGRDTRNNPSDRQVRVRVTVNQ